MGFLSLYSGGSQTYNFGSFIKMQQVKIICIQLLYNPIQRNNLSLGLKIQPQRILHNIIKCRLDEHIMMPGSKRSLQFLIISRIGQLQAVLKLADSDTGDLFKLAMTPNEGFSVSLEFRVEDSFEFEETYFESVNKLLV